MSKSKASKQNNSAQPDRRDFLVKSAATSGLVALSSGISSQAALGSPYGAAVAQPRAYFDSLVHGQEWFSLNPGYWRVENGTLRRRLENYGDRCRKTGFPFHATTHGFEYKTEYDPTQPT